MASLKNIFKLTFWVYHYTVNFFNLKKIFIFGCVESQLLNTAFSLSLSLRQDLSLWHMGSVAPQHVGLVLWPVIEPRSPALQGIFFTSGPPGKSLCGWWLKLLLYQTLAGSNALLQQLDLLWRQSWHQSPILCSLPSLLQQSVAPLPLGRPSSPRPCCTCPALVSREDHFICTSSHASGPCRGHFSAWSVLDPPGSPCPVLMSPLTWKFPNSATGGIVVRSRASGTKASTEGGVHNALSFRLFQPCWSEGARDQWLSQIQSCTPKD